VAGTTVKLFCRVTQAPPTLWWMRQTFRKVKDNRAGR
jgi:hypothetical protein